MRVRSLVAATAVLLGVVVVAPGSPALAATEASSVINDVPPQYDPSVYQAPYYATSVTEDATSHALTLRVEPQGSWQRTLTPADGAQLAAATTYALAPTPGEATLGVTGGYCPLEGTLQVRDLVRDANGAITALGADLAEKCVNGTATTHVSFRWHSTTPEPPVTRLRHSTSSTYATSYWFGYLDPGATSTATAFTVTNVGPVPATLGAVSLGGSHPADFTVTSDGCTGSTLLKGEVCTVQLAFTPTDHYLREAVLQVADGSLRGTRAFAVSGYAFGPPGPVTEATATTRSDGVQVRWKLPFLSGGRPLQYVEVLRGPTADDLQHLAQLAPSATSFGDVLGSATAPTPDADYVYGVRAHNLGGDGPIVTVSAHMPASATALTAHAVMTVDGALGAPYYPTQGHVYDAAAGAAVAVTWNSSTSGFLARSSAAGAPVVALSRYGAELVPSSYPTFGLSTAGTNATTCSSPAAAHLDVHEVAYDSSGGVVRLAADYLRRCTADGPAVAGVIRWHSDRPYTAVSLSTPPTSMPVKVGGATPLLVSYRNRGTTTVSLSDLQLLPTSSSTTTSGWSVQSNGCADAVLAPGAQCTATVTVTPGATGRHAVLVSFGDDTAIGRHTRLLEVYGVKPPAAPRAWATNAGSKGVALGWSGTYWPGGLPGPTSWQLYRKVGSGSYTLLKTLPVVSTYDTTRSGSYTDPDLRSGARTYLVRGVNVAGAGPWSAPVQVLYGPQAPRSVVAAGLTRRVVVNWQPPTSSFTAAPLSGYAVSKVSSSGALVRLATLKPYGVLSHAVTGLSPGAKVTLRVQALYGTVVGPASPALTRTATSSSLLFARNGLLMGRGVSGGPVVTVTRQRTFSYELGAPTTTSPAALSPDGRYAVLSLFNNAGGWPYQLVVRRTDGSGSQRILSTEAYSDFSPAVSPDGKWVAFTRVVNGEPYLYRIPWSGGTAIRVPNSKGLDEPSWAADGKSLWASRIADSSLGIVRITLAGSRKTVGTGRNESPVVSPDGKTVTFFTRSTANVSSLKVLTVSTGRIRTLVSNTGGWASRASWTPSSSTIYYVVSTTYLRRISRDGSGLTKLPSLGSGSRFVVYEKW